MSDVKDINENELENVTGGVGVTNTLRGIKVGARNASGGIKAGATQSNTARFAQNFANANANAGARSNLANGLANANNLQNGLANSNEFGVVKKCGGTVGEAHSNADDNSWTR